MKTPGTKFEIQVNGKPLADATVSIADQLEVNLASLAGQDGAVLAVTAFMPGAPKRDGFVHTKSALVSPGDTVTIRLQEVPGEIATRINAQQGDGDEGSSGEGRMTCSFCGKTHLEVAKIVAGPNAFICNECVAMCHDIVAHET